MGRCDGLLLKNVRLSFGSLFCADDTEVCDARMVRSEGMVVFSITPLLFLEENLTGQEIFLSCFLLFLPSFDCCF